MNSVTGMTAVFRRDVARAAQPFPLSGCRYILHDHWIALVASLLGNVRFIDEPLVDYTQHATNVMGARAWQGSLPRARSPSNRRTYLRKCFRQFSWRRRALDELRRSFADIPPTRAIGSPPGRSARSSIASSLRRRAVAVACPPAARRMAAGRPDVADMAREDALLFFAADMPPALLRRFAG